MPSPMSEFWFLAKWPDMFGLFRRDDKPDPSHCKWCRHPLVAPFYRLDEEKICLECAEQHACEMSSHARPTDVWSEDAWLWA